MDAGQEQGGDAGETSEQTNTTSTTKVSLNVKPLNYQQIGSMNGNKLAAMINAALSQIGMDLNKRNDVEKARKVGISLEFKPVGGDDNYSIDVVMKVKVDLPARESSAMRVANTDGKLVDMERPI